MTSIVFYTHGVFAVPIAESTGWMRGEVQFAFTIMSLMAVVTAPVVGWLIDRFGPRRIGLLSIGGFFVGLSMLSLTSASVSRYYLGFIAMAILGAGTLPVTWTFVVNQWFSRHRGLALGLALSGTGIAAALAPRYAGWLIERNGWQAAYFWLAVTVTLISLPLVWWLFRSPDVPRSENLPKAAPASSANADGSFSLGDALASYRLWVLCASVFLVAGSVAGLITSFVALLTDRSFSFSDAAGFASLIGVSVIGGRLLAGFLVDRIWAPGVAAVLLTGPAVAALLLDSSLLTPTLVSLCAVMIGLAAGAEVDLLAFLTSRYFGLRRYGSIYALTFVFFSVAAGLAPAAFGWVYDSTGSYSLALRFSAGACLLGAASMLTLGAYPDSGRSR